MMRRAILLLCLLLIPPARADEWQRFVRGPFLVWVRVEDVRNGREVLSLAERAFPEIEAILGEVSGDPVTLVVASSEAEFRRLTRGQIPEWGTAAADPATGTVILKSPRFNSPDVRLEQVIAHELAHVFLARAAGGRPVDRWFDEGFAQVVSTEQRFGDVLHLARSLASRQLIPLAAVDDVLNFQRSRATLAYRQSRSAVSYMMEAYGRSSIARIAEELRGGDMDAAMKAGIGIDVGTFEAEWVAAMKQAYRWYAFLDFPVILSVGMVTLFIAAFVLTRRRARKKRELWEEQAPYGMDQAEDTAPD